MKKFLERIKTLIRDFEVSRIVINKYYIAIIVFVVVTFCIGDSTLQKRYAYDQEINRLQNEIKYYTKLKDENSEKLESLKNNDESIEKFAREQFLMTKPNEDLYIITP